jgi:hypothetical protein
MFVSVFIIDVSCIIKVATADSQTFTNAKCDFEVTVLYHSTILNCYVDDSAAASNYGKVDSSEIRYC